MTTTPERTPSADLELLDESERLAILDWSAGAPVAWPDGPPLLHHGVFSQADRTPDAVALVWGDEETTYRRLAAQARTVARALRRRGVGPEVRVGVFLDRRPETVAALLGVLEAGGVYVPLDPEYPAERLAFMLADSAAALVLTRRELVSALPAGSPPALAVEDLDLDYDDIAGGDALGGGLDGGGLDGGGPDGDNLAYLIYTSGSTGRPKGVAIRHAGAVAMVAWARRTFDESELAGVLASTSICFDLSVFELFVPLSSGGAVILADDALALPRLPAADRVTLVNTVPSAIAELLSRGELPATVRTVNLAGEPLPRSLAERLYAVPTVGRVCDLYGPSEDTTYSTGETVPPGADLPVTIGRPVDGTRAWVVDPQLRPVGIGAAGELVLAGAGVARGYLGRPALTAERFVPDPFASLGAGEPGGRVYRTGDLARWQADGRIDFLGRLDHQVKLRGFRIELGEVEAALERQPGVERAIAAVYEAGGDRILVAWYVAERGASPASQDALRTAIASILPPPMVPSRLVRLSAFPLTPNGKIDRKALPAPGRERPEIEVPYVQPRDATEREIASLWAELLGLDRVGIDDPLLALGGHSLLAARIAARLGDSRGLSMPVVEVLRHPTVRALAERVGALAAVVGSAESLPPLVPTSRTSPAPLSFQQEQVWFIHQLSPDNLAYNFQYTVRLSGPLSRRVLERTLSEIVLRHEVLRTSFTDRGAGPVQVVGEPWAARVPEIDLRALPAARREELAERLVGQLVRYRFSPDEPPLVRWSLLRLAAEDSELVQVEHHFVHDGWSISVLLGELEALYAAFAAGRPSPLPALPVQFSDFATWQRRLLDEGHLDEQRAWWREHLADPPAPLELVTDRPRPREQSFRGDRLDVEIPVALSRDVREAARREGVTLYVLLTAAFEALLARWTGQVEMLLGTGVANRRLAESEPLIGMIVNTLVLRADLRGDPTFRELLDRVRAAAIDLQARPDLPLERLVADLQPDRDLSRNPLFQTMFSFHDAPVPDLDFGGGLHGALLERHNGSAKADMNVIVRPRAEQRIGREARGEDAVLRILWEFSTDLFDRTTVERMWEAWLRLLAQAVASPETKLSELDLLGEADRRTVLQTWNETAAPLPEMPVHRRVAELAAARPEATAIVAADGRRMTYGQLAERARRLADELAGCGVGRGDRVAICAGRTPEAVAAVLAVVGSGAAYVPLDPSNPPARLAATVADCAAAVVLTDTETAHALAELPEDLPILPLDGELPPSRGLALPEVGLDDLAYVVYTSGSTGAPKGVAVPHRGLANLVAWHLAAYDLGPEDRCPHLAGPAFDASVWELWPTLAAGAELHLAEEEMRSDPERLAAWLVERRITVAFLATPLAERVVPLEWPADTALRVLLTGGDALHRRPRPGLPFRLVNHYGPTESSVVATAGEVRPAAEASGRRPPSLGGPIANTRGYVLDAADRPAPPGVAGELWIAGEGLARGYVGRPVLTADRFRPDRFAERPGGRTYRTGDRVRWLADGRLEFLGRTDEQVKVRGFRIELGEVETVLASIPGVAACAVLAVDAPSPDGVAEKQLVAWWQPGTGRAIAEPDAEVLRAALAARLPEPMVPARFVRLAELPLTRNGKVDRKALPAPEDGGEDRSYAPPRGELEELLSEVWAEQVGGTRIGRGDHFFRLGGHSLSATRVIHRLRDLLDLDLPVSAIFDRPVLADFAAEIEARFAAEEDEEGGGAAAAVGAGRGAGAP